MAAPAPAAVDRWTPAETAGHGAAGVDRFDLAAVAADVALVDAARVDRLRRYRIPKVTPDGTCSLPNDLEPEPFELAGERALHRLRCAALSPWTRWAAFWLFARRTAAVPLRARPQLTAVTHARGKPPAAELRG
jgi:hypothetical protein